MKLLIIFLSGLALTGLAQGQPASNRNTAPVPVLEWLKQVGDSGTIAAVASATDPRGNFYLVGNTSSLRFPTVSAAQPQPGGSPLMRIDSTSARPQVLLSPLLTNAVKFAVDPENPSTVYAAASSGLIRSTDSGLTWSSIDTFPAVSQIGSITVDPTDSNVLYVAANTQGLFRSLDGGLTWAALNQTIPRPSNGNFYVNQLWVDPRSLVLFATSSSGLIRGTNSGASWSAVLVNDITSSLVFDPFTPGTIYEDGAGRAGGGVYKSTDDGLTWIPLVAAPQWYPSQLVADPHRSGVLYFSAFPGIYQSVDGGATWTLKSNKPSSAIAADPAQPAVYASLDSVGVVRSTDGFTTYEAVIGVPATQILFAGAQLFLATAPSTDLFLVKLDSQGAILYSTYFGGSASDSAAGLATGADGSVYVTGATASFDFPVTGGAYVSDPPPGSHRNFVFKLNPDGSLAWSTYFADSRTTTQAIAVDQAGSAYITGATYGGLPVSDGVYQSSFQSVSPCAGIINIGPCPPAPSSAFLTKFNASGSDLVFSTYISHAARNTQLLAGVAIALDSTGNAYIASQAVILMSADGSALLASNQQPGAQITAIALDRSNNLYATGQTGYSSLGAFPTTPGAFQPSRQPSVPALPGQGLGPDAFVIKFDSTLSQVLASTLFGGEGTDTGKALRSIRTGM